MRQSGAQTETKEPGAEVKGRGRKPRWEKRKKGNEGAGRDATRKKRKRRVKKTR